MKFRNPWIDPRILQVRPSAAQAYLVRRGWKLLGPARQPLLLMYERLGEKEEPSSVLVPTELDDGPLLQRMIDLVGDLARVEDRYAGDVLTDILQGTPAVPEPVNGPGMPAHPEPASK